jgi:hypothetical protein
MKLRLRGNSIRLRLSRSEVREVARAGCIEESTGFAPARLVYCLRTTASDGIRASFADGKIFIEVPGSQIAEWAEGTETGIAGLCGEVSVLIEKDWACTHGDAAENADSFPNPVTGSPARF